MSLDLQTADDKGNLPKRRVKDAKSAFAIFEQLLQADTDAAYNRSIVHRWTDGESPLDQADLEDAGQGWNSNVNSLRASADREQAVSGFNNLADSTPHLCEFTTSFGKPEERKPWTDAIAQKYDWLVKEHWSSFYSHRQKTADAYITDGLGVCYWPNDRYWWFEVGRLGQFLFPLDADVDESKQEIVLFVEEYSFSQLVKLLESDEKVRESKDNSHINREAVLEAIKDSAKSDSTNHFNDVDEFLESARGNLAYFDYAKSQKIKLVHYYVKESSGKITHSIGRADGKNKEYLSDTYEAYKSMQDVFVFYADGIGSWKLGSLKGQIYKALPMYMRNDILLNKMDDHMMLSLMKWLRSKNSTGKELLSQLTLGSLSILPPDIEFVETPGSADTGTQVFPLISQYERLIANNTGGYQQHAVSPEGGNRTAREVTLQAASSGNLSNAKLGNYYQSDDKLHANIYSRVVRDDLISIDEDYDGIIEFYSQLVNMGVPMQAIKQAKPKAVRAIGYGSFQQQQSAFAMLDTLIPYMDQVGQQNLAKDKAASTPGVGYDATRRYFTQDTPRTPEGTREALNEHDTFRNGSTRPVFADDPHIVHAVTHNQFLSETINMLHQGQMDTPSAIKQMAPALQHQQQHLQLATKDPSKEDVLKELFKQFGQFSTMFEKLQQRGEQQPQPPPQQDPKMLLEQQKAQADIARQDALAQAEIRRENAKTDNHIQNQNIKTGAHIQTNALKTASSVIPNSVEAIQPPQFTNQP